MHVISRKRLNEFALKYPEITDVLTRWYLLAKRNNFANFAEVRATFRTVDKVGKLTVFNIGGNKIRLIAAIHYNRKKIYVRGVLTHVEYDLGKWKD